MRLPAAIVLLLIAVVGAACSTASADPVEEVRVGYEILKSLGLRHRGVNIISCPSCARQGFDVIATVAELEKRLAHIHTSLSLSIIVCVVNGPGESKHADIGISLPGTGEKPVAPVYVDGEKTVTLKGDNIAAEFQQIVDDYVRRRFGGQAAS